MGTGKDHGLFACTVCGRGWSAFTPEGDADVMDQHQGEMSWRSTHEAKYVDRVGMDAPVGGEWEDSGADGDRSGSGG